VAWANRWENERVGYDCGLSFADLEKKLLTLRKPCVTLPQNIKAKPNTVPKMPESGIN
jgi:hypothetical protein